jgi:arylsulfatase A-like enzyme
MTRIVLYITVDALRADRMGFLGCDRGTTPVLDDLAADGTVFERAVANGIPTYYSFKSLLGGIHSLSHRRSIGLPETATALAEVFADAGYVTAGFNARNPWLTDAYGYDRGFDTYRDFMGGDDSRFALGRASRTAKRVAKRAVAFSETLTDRLGRYGRIASAVVGSQPLEPAESVTDAAIEWLDSRDGNQPFFLWIHYMDPHYPWVPPSSYLDDGHDDLSRIDIGSIWHTVAHEYKMDDATVDEELLGDIERLYDGEVRRTDAEIGRLLDAIGDTRDETIVTVAGDHGTELTDHGGFSHGPRTLYDEILRVPLLFHGPGVPDNRNDLAGLVDVPRTVVGLVDDVAPPETFEGIDLFGETRSGVCSEVVYDFDPARNRNAENGLLQARTEPPWKLIRNEHTGTTELYHVAEDPSEREQRTNETVQSELEAALDSHRDRLERRNRTIAEKQRIRERVAELKAAGVI